MKHHRSQASPEPRRRPPTLMKILSASRTSSYAITNAYSAIEGLTRVILGNEKNFENNSNTLVDFLELPGEYKNIVHYYKQIAHNYSSRHAGEEFSHAETEAFVYLTGLLMRLISEKATQRAKGAR
jgi:hypothetical protein